MGRSMYVPTRGRARRRTRSRRRATGQIQLGEDVAHVPGDGLLADDELTGDRAVRLGRWRRDGAPPAREPSARSATLGPRVGDLQQGPTRASSGAAPSASNARRAASSSITPVSSSPSARQARPIERPHACRLVRRIHLQPRPPCGPRAPAALRGRRPPPAGRSRWPPQRSRAAAAHRAAPRSRPARRRPAARRRDVAGGEHDLDERGEQPGPLDHVGHLVDLTRRIAAAAASTWPCARRSWARPGCGGWPNWFAWRYGRLASSNRPRSRWSSASR